MSTLLNAMVNDSNVTRTTNGMKTHRTSLDSCVDFFFQSGASRGKNLTDLFSQAYADDVDVAVRLALYTRDARGGQGERQMFKDVFAYILSKDTDLAGRVLSRLPEIGRWDDVLIAFGTPLERNALSMIALALNNGDGLCAKWMPRPSGKNKAYANKIRSFMQVTPKEYRKMLVNLSETVEQKMCAGKYDEINYSHVPSLAAARYQAAFAKADPIGYTTYREGLKKGEKGVKVNAGAVYPYDVIKSLKRGDETVANAQWAALPDYLEGSEENILPMVDVSGSMTCSAGGMREITCMDVATSLGLYVAERNNGLFKDAYMTFDSSPKMMTMKGDLSDKLKVIRKCYTYGSTNLEAGFTYLLTTAVKHGIVKSEMPTQILILSDMQFNQGVSRWNESSIEVIERKYREAGYDMPKVVYWNINAQSGQSPVTADKNGTALVSGFSPSIMATVLGADPEEFTPRAMMLQAVKVERYDY